MGYRLLACMFLLGGMIGTGSAQQSSIGGKSTSCTFQDGKQISIRYQKEQPSKVKMLPEGKLWTPGGKPMFLFTQTKLEIGKSEIPIGAFSMYVIPQHDTWIVVLNSDVTEGSRYDEGHDLLRAEAQLGQLREPTQEPSIVLGHVAPRQCNLRVYYGKTGAWLEFKEK